MRTKTCVANQTNAELAMLPRNRHATRDATAATLPGIRRLGLVNILLAAFALLLATPVMAQSANDGYAANPSHEVEALAIQSDGKAIVAGKFTTINGQARVRIARLFVDGSVDPSFAATVVDHTIETVAIQSSGHIIIGGRFNQVGACACPNIARLRSNGTVDTNWVPGGANDRVHSLAIQPDGKVLVGGRFWQIRGLSRSSIARLHANGSVDTSFYAPSPGANGTAVSSLAVQSDGKILVGGSFTELGAVARRRIARLNINGSLDHSFYPPGGAGASVSSIIIRPDGKLVVGGTFQDIGGMPRNRIAQLNPNGSVDTSFSSANGANSQVVTLNLQPDGKVLMGGVFSEINSEIRRGIARLNINGTLDTGFDPNVSGRVLAFAIQGDDKILIGGRFAPIVGVDNTHLERLSMDGTREGDFVVFPGVAYDINALALQPDGKVLVGGEFDDIGGVTRSRIARFTSNGRVDTSFNANLAGGPGHAVEAIAVQPDGKVLVAGHFSKISGYTRNNIARLNPNGSPDLSFNPGGGTNNFITGLAVQPDGKVLIIGNFSSVGGVARNRIARLHVDGSLDTSYYPPGGANGAIAALAVQRDGKVVLGGSFTKVGGLSRNRIARLNADGSLDTGFYPPGGANFHVFSVVIQQDDQILLGGEFTKMGGVTRNRLARLYDDGSIDPSFNPSVDPATPYPYPSYPHLTSYVRHIALRANGKILISGSIQNIAGASVGYYEPAQLHRNGTIDADFDMPAISGYNILTAMAIQADGKVLIAGGFNKVGGIARNGMARLSTREPVRQSLYMEHIAPGWSRVSWDYSGPGHELTQRVQLLLSFSGNPGTFSHVDYMTRFQAGWRIVGFTPPLDQNFSLRVQAQTRDGGNSSGLFESTRRFYVSSSDSGGGCGAPDTIFCNGFE